MRGGWGVCMSQVCFYIDASEKAPCESVKTFLVKIKAFP